MWCSLYTGQRTYASAELATDVSIRGLRAAVSRAGVTNPHSNGHNRSHMRITFKITLNTKDIAKNDTLSYFEVDL